MACAALGGTLRGRSIRDFEHLSSLLKTSTELRLENLAFVAATWDVASLRSQSAKADDRQLDLLDMDQERLDRLETGAHDRQARNGGGVFGREVDRSRT